MRKVGRPSAQETAFDRSLALKKSALDLLSSGNSGKVTIKDIGREAGVTTAMIYYYFEDKDDLLRSAIEYAIDNAFEHFEKLSQDIEHPAALIHEWLRTHEELVEAFTKMMKLNLDYKMGKDRTERTDEAIERFYDAEKTILLDCVKKGIRLGIFAKVEPESIWIVVSTFLDGAMVRSRIVDGFDVRKAIAALEALIWDRLDYQGKGFGPTH
jgi:AcrR family transcriptional regulator